MIEYYLILWENFCKEFVEYSYAMIFDISDQKSKNIMPWINKAISVSNDYVVIFFRNKRYYQKW